MMNNIDFLLKKYKSNITPGEKSIEKLIDFLKLKVDIEKINATDLVHSFQPFLPFNVVHCMLNQKLKLTANELEFLAYKLRKDTESKNNNLYYQLNYAHLTKEYEDDIIYVIFEKKTGFMHSNCNKLLLELLIERGVSKYDYDHNTPLFLSHLSYLERYLNGDY